METRLSKLLKTSLVIIATCQLSYFTPYFPQDIIALKYISIQDNKTRRTTLLAWLLIRLMIAFTSPLGLLLIPEIILLYIVSVLLPKTPIMIYSVLSVLAKFMLISALGISPSLSHTDITPLLITVFIISATYTRITTIVVQQLELCDLTSRISKVYN